MINVMLNIAYVHAAHTPYVMEHYHKISLVSDNVSKTSNYQTHMSRDMGFPTMWYVVCATSKSSEQPAHTRSLIRVIASR